MGAPVEVIMPQIGESMREGAITRWLVQVGTMVERDQPLFEISTDKVEAEVPSPHTGVLSRVLYPEGTTVPINTVVALINDQFGFSSVQQIANPASPDGQVSAPSKELRVPPMSITPGQQETKNKRSDLINLLLAASIFGFFSSYLRAWMPFYAAYGVSFFVGGLVSYPSIGRKGHSFGRWSLWMAIVSICSSIFIFIGPIVRRWW